MKKDNSKPFPFFWIILSYCVFGISFQFLHNHKAEELKEGIKKDIPKLCAIYHRFTKGELSDQYDNIIPESKGLLSNLSTDSISLTIEEAKDICGED